MGRFKYDDAWDDLEEFYGDDLEINDEEFVNNVEYIPEDMIIAREGEDVEIVDRFIFDIIDPDGNPHPYEMLGRIDIEGRIYLLLHEADEEDDYNVVAVRAFDNEDGEMCVQAIEDPNELKEVEDMANKLLKDDPNAVDAPLTGEDY